MTPTSPPDVNTWEQTHPQLRPLTVAKERIKERRKEGAGRFPGPKAGVRNVSCPLDSHTHSQLGPVTTCLGSLQFEEALKCLKMWPLHFYSQNKYFSGVIETDYVRAWSHTYDYSLTTRSKLSSSFDLGFVNSFLDLHPGDSPELWTKDLPCTLAFVWSITAIHRVWFKENTTDTHSSIKC